MADFESTANAAVTKLQEVDEIVTSTKQDFDSFEEHLEQADHQIHETAIEIMSAIDELLAKISAARKEQSTAMGAYKERLDAVAKQVETTHKEANQELTTAQNKVVELTAEADKVQDSLKQHLAGILESLSSVRGRVDSTSELIDTSYGHVHDEVMNFEASVEDLTRTLQQSAEGMNRFVEEEIVVKVEEEIDTISTQLEEIQGNVSDTLSDLKDQVDQSVDDTVQQVNDGQQTKLDESNNFFERIGETLKESLENVQSAGTAIATVKDTMCVAMKTTNVGLESAVDTLKSIKEIFEKIV